jgi:hypothetical protein
MSLADAMYRIVDVLTTAESLADRAVAIFSGQG